MATPGSKRSDTRRLSGQSGGGNADSPRADHRASDSKETSREQQGITEFPELSGQDVVLGDVYQSMAVSEGAETPRSHYLGDAGRGSPSRTAGQGNGNSGQTLNYLREDYEQLQEAMGIISSQPAQETGSRGGSRAGSPGLHSGQVGSSLCPSPPGPGSSIGQPQQKSNNVSVQVANTSRSNFEALSREMLVDYCWEVHQTMLRALYATGSDGNLIGHDGTVLGPRPPSTLYAGMMSRHASMTASSQSHHQVQASSVHVMDGMGNRVESMVNMKAGRESSPSSLQPQPPHERPRSRNIGGSSSTILTMGRGASNLSSAMTAHSSTHSIQSIARPPVQTTQQIENGRDEQGRKMINQYCILDEIGKGCFGKVKLAYNTTQGQLVAIKVMKRVDPSKRGSGSAQQAINAAHRNRSMQKEIAVMKKLRHKNNVSLFEVIDDPASCSLYLVMQYIDLGALGAVDKYFKCGRVDQKTMANYGRQICAGLQYLHNHNVVHRDIKPDNILKDSNDQVYLADFGVSEMFDDGELVPNASEGQMDGNASQNERKFGKRVHGRRGTPAFMAPELMSSATEEHDGFAIDVWALGVTFYALLFGIIPFCSKDEIVQKVVQFPKVSDYREGEEPICDDWVNLLTKMLHKNPSDRPDIETVRKTVRTMHKAQELKDITNLKKANNSKENLTSSSGALSEEEFNSAITPMQPTSLSAVSSGETGYRAGPDSDAPTTIADMRKLSSVAGSMGYTSPVPQSGGPVNSPSTSIQQQQQNVNLDIQNQHQSPQLAMGGHGSGASSSNGNGASQVSPSHRIQPMDLQRSDTHPDSLGNTQTFIPQNQGPSKVSEGMKLPDLGTPRPRRASSSAGLQTKEYPSSGPPSSRLTETHNPPGGPSTARGTSIPAPSSIPPVTPRSQVVTITNKTAASKARAKLQKLEEASLGSGGGSRK